MKSTPGLITERPNYPMAKGRISPRSTRPKVGEDAPIADALADLWDRRDRRISVSEAVYRTVYDAIVSGLLPPGTHLGEEALARRFAVSRTPAREAVLRLEAERLADRGMRRGLVVASVTPDEIIEIYVVREALDGLAARLAAVSARPSDVETMRWHNDQLREAIGNSTLQSIVRRNIAFHEAMYKAAHNLFLMELIHIAHDRVRRFPGTSLSDPGRAMDVTVDHDQLIEAIEERDADKAEQIARRHIARAVEVRIQLVREMTLASGLGR